MADAVTSPRPAGIEAPFAVCSHDEFSPLTQVVVGTAAGARIPAALDRSAWLNLYPGLSAGELSSIQTGTFPSWLLDEAAEDLESLTQALRDLGVRVYRPAPVAHEQEFATPHWQASGFGSYCPRDLALVVGNMIIQAPSPMRARMFELAGLRPLFQQAMLAGSVWIAAPPPELREDMFPLVDGRPVLGETEPAFDAANVLRCGHDLYYLVSGSGNELGLRWLQETLSAFGDYRVHPVRGAYPYTHIDSTISLIRPGLALLNPARITSTDLLPEPLRSWQQLWCPRMTTAPPAISFPLSSPWIGMNLLMVRPDLAIVDAAQHELIAVLNRHGVEVIPQVLRHARVLGGGFHCITLDLHRVSPDQPAGTATQEVITISGHTSGSAQHRPLTARYEKLRAAPARRVLEVRSQVIDTLRRELHDDGYTEVDTPLLQRARPVPGRSFRTETRTLDPHTYLRSSPLHLRAMLTTGMRLVFEIGRTFRDEPADPTHSPEYTLVELYQAGADYQTLQATAQKLITAAALAATGGIVIRVSGGDIDLAQPWPVIPLYQAVSTAVGEEIGPGTPTGRLRDLADRHHVPIRSAAAGDLVLTLYDQLVEATTTGPVIYTDFPAGPSPLARPCPHDRRLAQKWDLVIGGREIATAYTEQTDVAELRRCVQPDGDRILPSEAAALDDDWLAVFAAGMPAAGGLCIGLERLLLTLTGAEDLRDVIPFPLPPAP